MTNTSAKHRTPSKNTNFFTRNEMETIFKMYNSDASIDQIAEKFPNRSRQSLILKMQRMGLSTKNGVMAK